MTHPISTRALERALDHLADIPHLAAEAWATWGTNADGDDTHTRRVPGSVTLADVDRMVMLDQRTDWGVGVLHQWVRVMIEERNIDGEPWPHDTVDDAAGWIASRADWWAAEPWAPDLVHEIARLWRELRALCGYREVWLPRCRTCGDRIVLYDIHQVEIDPQRLQSEGLILDHTRCAGCGHVMEPGLALEALARVRYHPLTEIADMIEVPARTLYRWADQGLIRPVDERPGVRLYSYDEVRRVARRVRAA